MKPTLNWKKNSDVQIERWNMTLTKRSNFGLIAFKARVQAQLFFLLRHLMMLFLKQTAELVKQNGDAEY